MAVAKSKNDITPINDLDDLDAGPGTLKRFGGSSSKRANNFVLNEVLATHFLPDYLDEEARRKRSTAALMAMGAFAPKDEIEAMMAGQAVGLHYAAMECLRRAMLPEQPFEVASKLRKEAANLSRAMTDMVDALDRKRGKNRQQTVRVERVVVQEGGQAIVGNVTAAAAAGTGGSPPAPRSIEHAEPGVTLDGLVSAEKVPVCRRGEGE